MFLRVSVVDDEAWCFLPVSVMPKTEAKSKKHAATRCNRNKRSFSVYSLSTVLQSIWVQTTY